MGVYADLRSGQVPRFMALQVARHVRHNDGNPRYRYSRVSVPMFDPGARGVLVRCGGCDKVWAA